MKLRERPFPEGLAVEEKGVEEEEKEKKEMIYASQKKRENQELINES